MNFTILTGMSGSGKTNAIHFFEDLGYFCIDNMPPLLIPMLTDIFSNASGNFRDVALVVDVRVGEMINQLLDRVKLLKEECNVRLIFLDATDSVLVKRYKETRRNHPLNNNDGLLASIEQEREMLSKLREEADYVIDTSELSVAQLRDRFVDIYNINDSNAMFEIKVMSFGFKHGIPMDADNVYDVRCFPNPFYIPELKEKTGNDKAVQDYVLNSPSANEFLKSLKAMMDFMIPMYIEEGRKSLIIAIGCTGGHHRSVTFVNKLSEHLTEQGYKTDTVHRDINI